MREILGDFTKPGELVRIRSWSSGTTGVAAVPLGAAVHRYRGQPGILHIACRRIDRAARQPDLFIAPVPLRPKERR
jgi:hypothetical protein